MMADKLRRLARATGLVDAADDDDGAACPFCDDPVPRAGEQLQLDPCACPVHTGCLLNAHAGRGNRPLSCPRCRVRVESHKVRARRARSAQTVAQPAPRPSPPSGPQHRARPERKEQEKGALPEHVRLALARKLAVAFVFAFANVLAWKLSGSSAGDLPLQLNSTMASASTGLRVEQHHWSGVGLVTTDGSWGKDPGDKFKGEDIKILGFTDRNYLPIARLWYTRMTILGYTEHYIVAHDEQSYNSLRRDHFRVIPCIIKNPDYGQPIKGLWQQIMSARLKTTANLLRNGTHLLITDIDNVFSRYVPLYGFLEEGYDVYHAYEMRYPVPLYNEFGFVICSGHQFLRSSPETLKFMDLVMNRCRWSKCDDQFVYNAVLHYDLKMKWDGIDNPDNPGALRVNTTHPENGNLLVESVTGRSPVTNHTVKIWDRDFAWRLAGAIPEHCPSIHNWVGMPTKLDDSLTGFANKVYKKIAQFDVWDQHCRVERWK